MRILVAMFLAMLIIVFPFSGCRRERTLEPFHWQPAGGEFDSLTNKLEWQFNDYAPFDSIRKSIEKMESIAELDSVGSNIKKSRALYWKSRYLARIQKYDSAIYAMEEAILINDSVTYRYDRLRMQSILFAIDNSIGGDVKYRFFEECMDYAKRAEDKAFMAYISIQLGIVLNSVGESDKALYYIKFSESINNALGYKKLALKNKVNEAYIYEDCGNREKSNMILKSLIGHPYMDCDTFMKTVILGNLYLNEPENKKYLYGAYNTIKYTENFKKLRGTYSGLLIAHCLSEGKVDSATYYMKIAREDLPYVSDYEHKAAIWANISNLYASVGKLDSCLYSRLEYEAYLDSMYQQQRAAEVLRLSALQEMKSREMQYEAAIYRRNVVTGFAIGGLILAGVVAAWLLNRRHLRQRVKAMESELELEKARKKMAATAISMEEKDKVLDALKTGLSELREEGEIKAGDVRQLESAIKSHMLEHDTDEAFQEMFDVVNPGFKSRLKERCPNLADSYVKLACYILMELDNKKIAKLMMIKPESVHQARWRLRQRLCLKEGETLESALETLNKSRS